MQTILEEKLCTKATYTNEELNWCLVNIGNPDSYLRDDLIYGTFCHAFEYNLISINQVNYLSQQILARQLLQSSDVLVRSFSALLVSLILYFDNNSSSPFYNTLANDERQFFFLNSLEFLSNETDSRGYDSSVGWIHAIAHGSDLLLASILHTNFPISKLPEVLETLALVFKHQTTTFSAGESERLAMVILQLIKSQKLATEAFINWLNNLNFTDGDAEAYSRLLNVNHFLSTIYIELDKDLMLSSKLKEVLLSNLTIQ